LTGCKMYCVYILHVTILSMLSCLCSLHCLSCSQQVCHQCHAYTAHTACLAGNRSLVDVSIHHNTHRSCIACTACPWTYRYFTTVRGMHVSQCNVGLNTWRLTSEVLHREGVLLSFEICLHYLYGCIYYIYIIYTILYLHYLYPKTS